MRAILSVVRQHLDSRKKEEEAKGNERHATVLDLSARTLRGPTTDTICWAVHFHSGRSSAPIRHGYLQRNYLIFLR